MHKYYITASDMISNGSSVFRSVTKTVSFMVTADEQDIWPAIAAKYPWITFIHVILLCDDFENPMPLASGAPLPKPVYQ